MRMSSETLRRRAAELDAEAEIALEAGDLDLAQELYKKATVLTGAAMMRQEQESAVLRGEASPEVLGVIKGDKPMSLRKVAEVIGYSQPAISEAMSGKYKIPEDVAKAIERLRPDLPATLETYPKGWSDQSHHRSRTARLEASEDAGWEYEIERMPDGMFGVKRRNGKRVSRKFDTQQEAQDWIDGKETKEVWGR